MKLHLVAHFRQPSTALGIIRGYFFRTGIAVLLTLFNKSCVLQNLYLLLKYQSYNPSQRAYEHLRIESLLKRTESLNKPLMDFGITLTIGKLITLIHF